MSHSIPYVRFDGKMSAKRRQETLDTFSVPIENDSCEATVAQPIPMAPVSEVQSTRRSVRSSRRGESSAGESHQDSEVMSIENDDDDDFVLGMDADSDDGAHDARTQSKKGKGKGKGKSKGKGKGKGKGKMATRSHLTPVGDNAAYDTSTRNGVNPKIMLISLKAGALGLNLTVANNVYL
jgi:SWI/SNF-related matrix-associated actin-dependent regulator of chromatin subfamily A3